MSSAIEVLKKAIVSEFDEIKRLKVSFPEMGDCIDWHQDRKEAFEKSLLALEINENLINDLLLLANIRADDTITGNEIISCLLKNKVNIVQGKDFMWERVGEKK